MQGLIYKSGTVQGNLGLLSLVSDVIRKLLICVGISLEAVLEAAAVQFGILSHRWG